MGRLMMAAAAVLIASALISVAVMRNRRARLIAIRYTEPSLSVARAPTAEQRLTSRVTIYAELPWAGGFSTEY